MRAARLAHDALAGRAARMRSALSLSHRGRRDGFVLILRTVTKCAAAKRVVAIAEGVGRAAAAASVVRWPRRDLDELTGRTISELAALSITVNARRSELVLAGSAGRNRQTGARLRKLTVRASASVLEAYATSGAGSEPLRAARTQLFRVQCQATTEREPAHEQRERNRPRRGPPWVQAPRFQNRPCAETEPGPSQTDAARGESPVDSKRYTPYESAATESTNNPSATIALV